MAMWQKNLIREAGVNRLLLGPVVVLLTVGFFLASPLRAQQGAEKAAQNAALAWLALIDEGKYKESWAEAAPVFKDHVTAAQWEKMAGSARNPLGKVTSRKLAAARYATSLPGVPDGEYVVIQYATSFEKKKSAVEMVTPAKGEDGQWRVSGYYIK
jgi:uncharacterized protein YbaA (DUF1428 family)